MKHKRDDGPEKQEDEAVDVTPVMICVFVVMCCFMLVLLYYFYDRLGMPPAQTARAPPTSQSPSHSRVLPSLSRTRSKSLEAIASLLISCPSCPSLFPVPCLPDPAVYVIIGIFCLASSTGLYSCLAPCVRKLPFCTCR